ncbi:MAG: hypothetical protein JNM56_06640 [Planctomycetia bacterium]|nr:hypothetical protein [Planctomycetia bacterium]
MSQRTIFAWGLLMLAVSAVGLRAQIPGIPSVPGVPGVPTAPTTGAYPSTLPAAPSNIWSMLCPTSAQTSAWKQAFCGTGIGTLFSAMLSPVSLYTGGLMGSCCPPGSYPPGPPPVPGSPEDTADKIKADEAAAKARRAAMRYLGTVDCHYWPEAEKALIAGLRTDKNDCVRWEAAHSLGNGCCCTRKTIAALKLTVEGSEADGNPAETSIWVRGEALASLQHCICCFRDKPSEVPKEKPSPSVAAPPPPGPVLPAYYNTLNEIPRDRFVADASQVIAQAAAAGIKPGSHRLQPGSQSVSNILAKAGDPRAFPPPTPVQQTNTTEPPLDRLQPVAAPMTQNGTHIPTKPYGRDLYTLMKERWGWGSGPVEHQLIEAPAAQPMQAHTAPMSPQMPAMAPPMSAVQPAMMMQPVQSAPAPSNLPPAGRRDLLSIFRNSVGGQ